MESYFKFIDYCHNLITEEVLKDPFKARLVKSKLNSYKVLYSNNLRIKEIIDNIIEEFFSDQEDKEVVTNETLNSNSPLTSCVDKNKNVYLNIHYTGDEINQINKIFGFPKDNFSLTESTLNLGYLQNQEVSGAKDWYERLKFFHFTDFTKLTSQELKALHQKFDLKAFAKN